MADFRIREVHFKLQQRKVNSVVFPKCRFATNGDNAVAMMIVQDEKTVPRTRKSAWNKPTGAAGESSW